MNGGWIFACLPFGEVSLPIGPRRCRRSAGCRPSLSAREAPFCTNSARSRRLWCRSGAAAVESQTAETPDAKRRIARVAAIHAKV